MWGSECYRPNAVISLATPIAVSVQNWNCYKNKTHNYPLSYSDLIMGILQG